MSTFTNWELSYASILSYWAREAKLSIPTELIRLVITLYLEFLPVIDIYDSHYFEVNDEGTIIQAKEIRPSNTTCYALNVYWSKGLIHGIYTFKVKLLGGYNCFCNVGVVTNPNFTQRSNNRGKRSRYIEQDKGNISYFFYGDNDAVTTNEYFEGKNHEIYRLEDTIWKTGQIVTVTLDLNNYTVLFFKQHTQIGDKISIQKDRTYYIALGICDRLSKMEMCDSKTEIIDITDSESDTLAFE